MEYSIVDAKAKFSAIISSVIAGERVVITKHGKQIAEINPIVNQKPPIEKLLMFRRVQRAATDNDLADATASTAADFLYDGDGVPK